MPLPVAATPTGEVADPDVLGRDRLPPLVAHLGEQRRRLRVLADVVDRLDLGMPLHVGLPDEDVDLQLLGPGRRSQRQKPQHGRESEERETLHLGRSACEGESSRTVLSTRAPLAKRRLKDATAQSWPALALTAPKSSGPKIAEPLPLNAIIP